MEQAREKASVLRFKEKMNKTFSAVTDTVLYFILLFIPDPVYSESVIFQYPLYIGSDLYKVSLHRKKRPRRSAAPEGPAGGAIFRLALDGLRKNA